MSAWDKNHPMGLMPKVDHGYTGHPWASRDYQDIDCKASACINHRAGKCLIPSKAVININGQCEGFETKQSGQ